MGPISHCLFNATMGAPVHSDKSEKHPCFTAKIEDIATASNIHITSMHATLNALLVRWKIRRRGTFLLSGGGFCFDGAKAVNWSPGGIPSWEIGGAVKAYWKCFAEAANVTMLPFGIRIGCLIIERIIGMGWGHGIPEAYVMTPEEVGEAFYTFSHRTAWTPTEIWPPRSLDEVSSSGGEEKDKVLRASVSLSQFPAESCKIVSHTKEHVTYKIEVEGVSDPWAVRVGSETEGEKVILKRRFRDFKQIYQTLVRIAKKAEPEIASPPRMPDGGGAAMWLIRRAPKTIQRRMSRFNEMLEYMIKTPVINEHDAVMEFLGLKFNGEQYSIPL